MNEASENVNYFINGNKSLWSRGFIHISGELKIFGFVFQKNDTLDETMYLRSNYKNLGVDILY